MSVNGLTPSSDNPTSPSRSPFPELNVDQVQKQKDGRSSFDSERSGASSPPANTSIANGVNGQHHSDDPDPDPLLQLQKDLERTKEEKETLAAQYRTLLAKLTTMRTTLGNKLKQDAVSAPVSSNFFFTWSRVVKLSDFA